MNESSSDDEEQYSDTYGSAGQMVLQSRQYQPSHVSINSNGVRQSQTYYAASASMPYQND